MSCELLWRSASIKTSSSASGAVACGMTRVPPWHRLPSGMLLLYIHCHHAVQSWEAVFTKAVGMAWPSDCGMFLADALVRSRPDSRQVEVGSTVGTRSRSQPVLQS